MGLGSSLLIELQEFPEYKEGWEAYERHESRDSNPVVKDGHSYMKRMAWHQGWNDAKNDEYMSWDQSGD